MDISMLNPMQRKAVETVEGPLLVLAGAGSGKTRVLTNRIGYLIEEKDVFPSQILAITFTNKAAGEMKARIEGLIGPISAGMWVGTFHATCVRILRRDIERLGYTKDFVIYDPADQKTLVKECLKELNIDDKTTTPKFVINKISEAKNDMLTPEAYSELYWSDYQLRDICKLFELYQKKLKANNAMDFDDLILKAITLLEENDEVLSYYQRKFHYVMVDEYQDTNKAQYTLVKMLSEGYGNLCVVGDIDQSIYGWRGADIRNIRDFEKDYKNATLIKLEQNYRSTEVILNAANAVIERNTSRKPKKLWTDRDGGELIRYYMGQNEYDESRFVAEKIRSLHRNDGRAWEDFAILYRTNAQSRVLEESLMRENIPYRIVGGLKFYDRKEVKDAMAYLRLIQNPKDDVGVLRVVNVPKRGIGAKTIENVRSYARQQDLSLYEAIEEMVEGAMLPNRSLKGLSEFVQAVRPYMEQRESMPVSQIYEGILADTGYKKILELDGTIESRTRIDNLNEMLNGIYEFEKATEDPSLLEFLAQISLMSDIDGLDEEQDGILMMTLHSAKGLEFPVVFIVGMEEGIFPSSRSLDDDEGIEEERRLAYVGITRAEDQLFISHAYMRNQYGRTAVNLVSRFIEEIPSDLVDAGSGTIAVRKSSTLDFKSKMIDGFKPIRKVEPAGKTADPTDIRPGTKVLHQSFGDGTVITISGAGDKAIATIAFDKKGIKKLQVGMAPMEIVG